MFLLVAACLALPPQTGPGPEGPGDRGFSLTGTVVDLSGAAVPGAVVALRTDGVSPRETTTGPGGSFTLADVPGTARTLVVRAEGFATAEIALRAMRGPPTPLRIVLRPASFVETVTVRAPIATRRGLDSADVSVLTAAVLSTSGPATLDDALREVPGFQLFRRSSSRVSNPTTQGASLRGLSASGASRALVLTDNLPLNDAFGGWVHWNEVPQAAIDRLEVVRGGASDVYGGSALGGVVQVVTRDPARRTARLSVEGGGLGTLRASGWLSAARHAWHGAVAAERFETDGYVLVPAGARGRIDTRAGSTHTSTLAIVGRQWRSGVRAQARGSILDEDRKNGTPLQVNDTNGRRAAVDAGGVLGGGVWAARAWHGWQRYDQAFSAIAGDRASETLNRAQRVPSASTGAIVDWARRGSGREWLFGFDVRSTSATSFETPYAGGRALAVVATGGDERLLAAFAQASVIRRGGVHLVAGLRADRWRAEALDGTSRSQSAVSPRVSIAWTPAPRLTLRASAYGSFRPPTLNELYRGFRVGNVITLANGALTPERLSGVEGGLVAAHGRASTRVTVYWAELDDAIANVTVTAGGATITRQRRNADRVRAAGLEWEEEITIGPRLSVTGGAAWMRSRFATGLRVPQVPRLLASAGLRFVDPRLATLSLQVRYSGQQFEDDLNQLTMGTATIVDLYAGRAIARGVQAFVAVENALDAAYEVGRTPVPTVGLPRAARAGVRISWR